MDQRERQPEPDDARPAAWQQWDRAKQRPWWRRNIEWLIIGAAVVAIATMVVASRTDHPATATAVTPSPAQMLADLDGDTTPTTQYQAALDALAPKCTQDETDLAALANAGYQDLMKNSVTDETRLTVLQHLAGSVPVGAGRVDCTGILSAYLLLREG